MIEAITELAEAFDSFGPVLVVSATLLFLVIFFVWRDHKRELAREEEVQELHKVHNEIVLPLLTECKEAIVLGTDAVKQNTQTLESFRNWMINGRG